MISLLNYYCKLLLYLLPGEGPCEESIHEFVASADTREESTCKSVLTNTRGESTYELLSTDTCVEMSVNRHLASSE